jgi:hypothetical protein
VVEVGLAEPGRAPELAARVPEEPAEALARERGLLDLSPAEGRPKLVVDAPVGGDCGRGAGEAERAKRLPKGRAFGLVEVQKGVIEVEENGAEAVQAATSRGT